jgi:hypothetical protein
VMSTRYQFFQNAAAGGTGSTIESDFHNNLLASVGKLTKRGED